MDGYYTKPKQKTFLNLPKFSKYNTINVRNRQYITDGKTGGYPTLQSIYWKYLESRRLVGIDNDNFTYQTMINYVNGLGDYWIRLVEQMVPSNYDLEFFVLNMKTQFSIDKNSYGEDKWVVNLFLFLVILCQLVGQLFAYDCPIQSTNCPIYPWDSNHYTYHFIWWCVGFNFWIHIYRQMD